MWKKIILSVSLLIIMAIGIELFYYKKDKGEEIEKNLNVIDEEKVISYVTDDCLNEWVDYATNVEEEIKQTNQVLTDETRHYILKENEGYIKIYYINEKGEEILYRVTEIGTQYLEKEDQEKLSKGIEVIGLQNVNQLLEDFE